MSPDAKSLLDAALQLPESQRAEFAAILIESLDEGFDEDAEAAWQAEAERRLDDMLRGCGRGDSSGMFDVSKPDGMKHSE